MKIFYVITINNSRSFFFSEILNDFSEILKEGKFPAFFFFNF